MHKFLTVLLALLALQVSAPAMQPNQCCGCFTDVEFRVAYFYPINHHFRRIYNGARVDYQLQFTQHFSRCFDIWENVTWLPVHGHSIGEHHSTHLNLVPLSAGVYYRFCFNPCITFRLGLGGAYYFLRIHDKTPCTCIRPHRSFNNGGLVVKADAQYFFCGCNYFSLFIDYLYLPLNRSHKLCNDVGGFNFGAGIGHSF